MKLVVDKCKYEFLYSPACWNIVSIYSDFAVYTVILSFIYWRSGQRVGGGKCPDQGYVRPCGGYCVPPYPGALLCVQGDSRQTQDTLCDRCPSASAHFTAKPLDGKTSNSIWHALKMNIVFYKASVYVLWYHRFRTQLQKHWQDCWMALIGCWGTLESSCNYQYWHDAAGCTIL